MKQHYFVKFNPRINQFTGCQRATLILSALEYWFQKKPDGFYKFIEPCSHRLYKEEDSWAEQLGCDRRCFARSFKKIGVKYTSRSTFEKTKDKFQGKMYASYYDRYTNRTFFVRNHGLANETLKPYFKVKNSNIQKEGNSSKKPLYSLTNQPLSTDHNGLSYKESNNTSNNLSKDKSHAASNEIVKKMIELWTALVEDGKGQIDLTNRRIAFLKKAFTDKFDSCLEQWKKYCQDIASSRFLMGESKSSFRASLDWALKFDIIQKILEGNYGIGDRNSINVPSRTETYLKKSKIELAAEEEEIFSSTGESELIKTFRLHLINKLGVNSYRDCLKDCQIEVVDEDTLILRPTTRYKAKSIASYWTPSLLAGSPFTRVNIVQQEGDLVFDKWFGDEGERVGVSQHNQPGKFEADGQSIAQSLPESSFVHETHEVKISDKQIVETILAPESTFEETKETFENVTSKTKMLCQRFKESIPLGQFPSWLSRIEVEDISQDGTVFITLEDPLMVEWCRSRFSQEILQSAKGLWNNVSQLMIHQRSDIQNTSSSVGKPSENSENKQESTFEQAIQSLLSVCSLPRTEMVGEICSSFG